MSQDPVFTEVGLTEEGRMILLNPQLANSYSYAGNNPINGKDPSGRFVETAVDVALLANSVREYNNNPSALNALAVGFDTVATAFPIAPAVGGLGVRAAEKGVENTLTNIKNYTNVAPNFTKKSDNIKITSPYKRPSNATE